MKKTPADAPSADGPSLAPLFRRFAAQAAAAARAEAILETRAMLRVCFRESPRAQALDALLEAGAPMAEAVERALAAPVSAPDPGEPQ